MKVIQDDLWLCTDCLMAAVNDDYSGLDYYYKEPEATERMNKIKAGLHRLGPHLVCDVNPETWDGWMNSAAARVVAAGVHSLERCTGLRCWGRTE